MDLYIRSQDKKFLVPICDILSIFNKGIFYQGTILGIYKSEERALEVLDEIQKMLTGNEIIDFIDRTNGTMDNVFPIMTYEMPEE